jgi:hypothetical protein
VIRRLRAVGGAMLTTFGVLVVLMATSWFYGLMLVWGPAVALWLWVAARRRAAAAAARGEGAHAQP